MSKDLKRYELTTSLSVAAASDVALDQLAKRLENEVIDIIDGSPVITAYFVGPDYDAVEIRLGLRFEGLAPENIEDTATAIVGEAITRLSGPAPKAPVAVREESTLVPV